MAAQGLLASERVCCLGGFGMPQADVAARLLSCRQVCLLGRVCVLLGPQPAATMGRLSLARTLYHQRAFGICHEQYRWPTLGTSAVVTVVAEPWRFDAGLHPPKVLGERGLDQQ